jgi:hypothetical protein
MTTYQMEREAQTKLRDEGHGIWKTAVTDKNIPFLTAHRSDLGHTQSLILRESGVSPLD